MKAVKEGNSLKLIQGETKSGYYKVLGEHTSANTYTYNITEPTSLLIELIGGGGGSGQTDGGTDSYSDTGWAWHYGHNGAGGGHFKGIASLTAGTLAITVGAVGNNTRYSGSSVTANNGGDSYAIFTPTGGSAIEIARARGGHSGYPDGSNWNVSITGGTVTYNSTYITTVIETTTGTTTGGTTWSVKR